VLHQEGKRKEISSSRLFFFSLGDRGSFFSFSVSYVNTEDIGNELDGIKKEAQIYLCTKNWEIFPKIEVEPALMKNLSIILPEVKINIEDVKTLTLDGLEEAVFDAVRQMGLRAMETFLERMDASLKESRNKQELRHAGKRQKHFLTRMGPIDYCRTRYIDKSTGKSRYLLEEALKIDKDQRISSKRAQMEVLLATHDSYRKTQEHLLLLTGSRRSHEAGRQSVLKEAKRLIRREKEDLVRIQRCRVRQEEPESEIAYIEADSTMIRAQRFKKRKPGRKQPNRRRHLEIKLGIGYTGRTPRYKRGARLAQTLTNKFSYAGMGGGFMKNLSLMADKKLSLSKMRLVVTGGDGHPSIKNGFEENFVRPVYILCRYHLNRAIREALSLRKASQKAVFKLLRKDRIDSALGLIQRYTRQSKSPMEKEKLHKLHDYIQNNRSGINSVRKIPDKALRESVRKTGAIESNIDKMIAHRFKGRGMSWSPKGSLGLLKIKQLIANNEWDRWWSDRRDQEADERLRPIRYAAVEKILRPVKTSGPHLIETSLPILYTQHHEYRRFRSRIKHLIRVGSSFDEPRSRLPGRHEYARR